MLICIVDNFQEFDGLGLTCTFVLWNDFPPDARTAKFVPIRLTSYRPSSTSNTNEGPTHKHQAQKQSTIPIHDSKKKAPEQRLGRVWIIAGLQPGYNVRHHAVTLFIRNEYNLSVIISTPLPEGEVSLFWFMYSVRYFVRQRRF